MEKNRTIAYIYISGKRVYFPKVLSKLIKGYKWYIEKSGYVIANKNLGNLGQKSIRMHRLIMGEPKGFDIDHKNGNKLDNTFKNLRITTRSQNLMNKVGVKGYSYISRARSYRAYIKINQKNIYLGYFKKESDAILARRRAEEKYFGEFAYRNR